MRSVLPKALALAVLVGAWAAGPAFAQYYNSALRSIDLGSDVARSPRLLGMGGLSLSVPDPHQRLNLWDFAGSPVGGYGSDSTSSMELRPGSGSAAGAHTGEPGKQREDLAGRASGMGFELLHRDAQGGSWGATGSLRSIRTDNLFDQTRETRRTVSDPEIRPVIAGPFPYWGKGKLHYAVRMLFGREKLQDEYRGLVSNYAGEFISLNGPKVASPSLFDPLESTVRRTGVGAALSYPVGRQATLALGYDAISNSVTSVNDSKRSTSQVRENRPYGIAQATLVGRLGRSFEYGFDERHWTSSSQQDWRYSISAGVGAVPLVGEGRLRSREETGNAFDGRVRLTVGNLHLAGRYWTHMSRADYAPPAPTDPMSFNLFLSNLYYRIGADTLSLPDSVVANRVQENAFGYAGGAAWKFGRGVAGVEYHWGRQVHSENVSGLGPREITYDVRAGLEYQCSAIVAGRIGGGLLWRDQDELMRNDEWLGQSASLGLGLKPPGATWGVDLGWTITWLQPDFADPLTHRASHQQLQSLLHWTF